MNGNPTQAREMVPNWVIAMRQAAQAVIKADDVRQIVENQVALAKKGDRNAIRFVFEQVLGGAALKGATFVQNNYGLDGKRIEELAADSPEARREKIAHAAAASVARDEPLRWFCNDCGHEWPTPGPRPQRACPKCHGPAWRPVAAVPKGPPEAAR